MQQYLTELAVDSVENSVLPGIRSVKVVKTDCPGESTDWVAEEVPVALVYNGISHAVMMATPDLLKEFAVGFSLAEGIVPDINHIYDLQVKEGCAGQLVELTISSEMFWHLKERRRFMVGRTACGICGVDSLESAVRKESKLAFTQTFDMRHYAKSLTFLSEVEQLGELTGCTHAAVWVKPDGELAGGAEDVGRHVALDKLLGMRALRGWNDGALFVSSRASYEMVQKAVHCGVELLFAVSAPTALAIELADRCNLTLAAFSRNQRTNVYTHPGRLVGL